MTGYEVQFYIIVVYLSTCTVLAINVLKFYTTEFRWNFVWTKGQKISVVVCTVICCYIIPFRVYMDTIGDKK